MYQPAVTKKRMMLKALLICLFKLAPLTAAEPASHLNTSNKMKTQVEGIVIHGIHQIAKDEAMKYLASQGRAPNAPN